MTIESHRSQEKLKFAADISSALACQIAELLELREAVRKAELATVRKQQNCKKPPPRGQAIHAEPLVDGAKSPAGVTRGYGVAGIHHARDMDVGRSDLGVGYLVCLPVLRKGGLHGRKSFPVRLDRVVDRVDRHIASRHGADRHCDRGDTANVDDAGGRTARCSG
jgi:hypothetical protein